MLVYRFRCSLGYRLLFFDLVFFRSQVKEISAEEADFQASPSLLPRHRATSGSNAVRRRRPRDAESERQVLRDAAADADQEEVGWNLHVVCVERILPSSRLPFSLALMTHCVHVRSGHYTDPLFKI